MRRLIGRIAERLIDWLDGHDWHLGSVDLGVENEEDSHTFLRRLIEEEQKETDESDSD